MLEKPAGLDPQHGQSFNQTVVDNHFKLLQQVIKEKEIPWENIYNMDEKGCQWGGGQKSSPEKYFIPCGWFLKYKIHSGKLELVTIIECVSADSSSIAPGFVFSGKSYHKKWFKAHPDIW
ncbi:hypothetical protein M404DRAFT_127756 [Pisolithus tinctorius Marx 270]|uniref:DDE-1 domain-containing protein n=1 Tax=Pisolithus tinctorius Marx 270 TaxID=870435 RepID=A0A0C3KP90_PISTI|nr:hypothetical protein M404DRAFT_127756 [Pisolithus tinctorius Marx 270]